MSEDDSLSKVAKSLLDDLGLFVVGCICLVAAVFIGFLVFEGMHVMPTPTSQPVIEDASVVVHSVTPRDAGIECIPDAEQEACPEELPELLVVQDAGTEIPVDAEPDAWADPDNWVTPPNVYPGE